MIVWRGKGLLVMIAIFFGCLAGWGLFKLLSVDISTPLPYILQGFLMTGLSAGCNQLFANYFISKEVRIFTDEKTGQKYEVKDRSSLFYIPNKYWTWIILVIGLILTFVSVRTI